MANLNGIAGTSGTAGVIQPAIQAYYDRNLLDRAVPADVHGRFGQLRAGQLRFARKPAFRQQLCQRCRHALFVCVQRRAACIHRCRHVLSPAGSVNRSSA